MADRKPPLSAPAARVENARTADYTEGQIDRREVGMPVELSRDEKDLLVGLLEREFEEIRSEIHHTQNLEYKDGLKQREKLVQGLLTRLKT